MEWLLDLLMSILTAILPADVIDLLTIILGWIGITL